MTSTTKPHMPGTVLAAAILLGMFGGGAGLGLAAYGALLMDATSAAPALLAMGLLLAVFSAFAVWGLVRGDRGSQIVATIVGGLMVFGSMVTLANGAAIGALWILVGLAIILLVLAPLSSRAWFARG